LANVAAVAYFVWYLKARSRVQSVSLRDFQPTRAMLASIFSIGSSALIFSALMVVGSLLFNTYAMAYGDAAVAAFGVANRLVQIVEFLGAGLFAGIIPLMAFAYAAGQQKRLGEVVSTTTVWFLAITLVLGTLMYLFREPIFRVFSTDPEVLRLGFLILTAMLVSVVFNGVTSIFSNVFQAFGAGLQANLMSLVRGLALVPLIYLGNLWFGLTGVIWALPASEVTASLIGTGLWLVSQKALLSLPLERRRELAAAEE